MVILRFELTVGRLKVGKLKVGRLKVGKLEGWHHSDLNTDTRRELSVFIRASVPIRVVLEG